MRSRSFVMLMIAPTLIVVLAALAMATIPRGAQPVALPTLAVLASATPTPTPTDLPPTAAVETVIVVHVVTATLPPSATTPPTSTPLPTATNLPPSSTSTPTSSPTATAPILPTPTPTLGAVAILAQTYYVSVGSANLRACARLDCAIVAPLMRGDTVTVVGYTIGDVVSGSNIWFSVHFGGYVGYLHSSLVSASPPQPTAAPTSVTIQQSSGSGILCADGTISYAAIRDGACSYHGGIAGDGAQPTAAPTAASSSGGIVCADGTISHAAHRQGACSHHGGIAGG